MKRLLLWGLMLLLTITVVQSCSKESEFIENEDALAATVEDWSVTKEFIDEVIANLPDAQRAKYDTPAGRATLADDLIINELFFREAKRQKLDEKSEVKNEIDQATRAIMIRWYYAENVDAKARPSVEEMREYYNEHEDVYTSLPIARAQHIFSKSEEKLLDFKRRIEEGGEKMTSLAHKYSEDKLTQPDGGDLGYINPGGYIRSVGYSDELNDAIFSGEVKKLLGPIKWEKGYSLVRVNSKRDGELRPFEEVRGEISDLLAREKIDKVKDQIVDELRTRYTYRNYMEEYYNSVQRSPKELFEFAQTADDPHERLKAFEEIVEKFPEDEYAPQAMFMIGFVYIEELKDKVSGERALSKLINTYPTSDVAESAQWMLDNIDKPVPDFENVEDLHGKISEESE